jgi:hypothetical protein
MQPIVTNVFVLYLYAFFVFRSPLFLFVFYLYIPPFLIISGVIHGLLSLIAIMLKAHGQLTLINLLAFCGALSFLIGFIPQHPPFTPLNSLLEDYAASQLFYAPLLYGMCIVEWFNMRPSVEPAV